MQLALHDPERFFVAFVPGGERRRQDTRMGRRHRNRDHDVAPKCKGAEPGRRDRPPSVGETLDDHGTTWIVSRWIKAPGPGKPAEVLIAGELPGTQ